MKRIAFTILLGIIFLQLVGILFFYQVMQFKARWQMHEKIVSNEVLLESFTLAILDFNNSKVDKDEISISGKLYDIKSCSVIGDSIKIIAANDPVEQNIIQKIKLLISMNDETEKNSTVSFIKLIQLEYLPAPLNHLVLNEEPNQSLNIFFETKLNSFSANVLTPPPWFLKVQSS